MVGSVVLLSMFLTGCGGFYNAKGNNNNNGQQADTNQVSPTRVTYNNNIRTLRNEDRAEERVERLEEVEEAHVTISNHDAYVAIMLNHNNGNGRGHDAQKGNRTTFIENGTVNQGGNSGNAGEGTIDGLSDASQGDRQLTGADKSGSDNYHLGIGNENRNTNRQMGNITGKSDLNTDNYRAVSNQFEQKIDEQIRNADKKVNNVYITVIRDY